MIPISKRYQLKKKIRKIWGNKKKGCRGRPGKTGGYRLSKRSRNYPKSMCDFTL